MIEDLVQVHAESISIDDIQTQHFQSWITKCVAEELKSIRHVNIIFCSDEYLLVHNRTYLDHDYYTDIITFEYEKDPLEGDLFISIDRVKENADARGISHQDEVDRVVIHGILHLLGYNDKTADEQNNMRIKEDYFLAIRSDTP